MSTLLDCLEREDVSSSTRARFAAYDWCKDIFTSSTLIPVKNLLQHTSRFSTTTLRDHDTILAMQYFYAPPGTVAAPHDSVSYPGELHTLYALGDGASGHPGFAHGGVIATLFDLQLGSLLYADPAIPRPTTVSCNIRYRKPVLLPGAVKVCAWKEKEEGRNHWVRADMFGAQGEVLASAEGMWVSVNISEKL
ncbi:MAG: hypothetical protein M1820_007760 [Bogoriella megaspora]|nr:MAG: hypothetical protein M1820_007760 [Bogoriella megaspora]